MTRSIPQKIHPKKHPLLLVIPLFLVTKLKSLFFRAYFTSKPFFKLPLLGGMDSRLEE